MLPEEIFHKSRIIRMMYRTLLQNNYVKEGYTQGYVHLNNSYFFSKPP